MRPPMRRVPESGSTAPVIILMRGDFPAPFSPTSAWTSPGSKSKETLFNARTPEYAFEMLLASRSGMKDMRIAYPRMALEPHAIRLPRARAERHASIGLFGHCHRLPGHCDSGNGLPLGRA